MSQPKNLFQSNQPQAKAANIQQLTKQVQYWQILTKIIQPLLPQPEHWQVVCYQQGVLTITGENQAMISQLGYLQQHYVAQLSQREEFKDLQKIQVRLRTKNIPKKSVNKIQPMSAETQQMLQNAAQFVNDPKLSQAIRNLASVIE
ncbi:DciA family protein [Acinetobacter brisouii]|uniref:DciA family protein n=1 Tax=Acinetobacter brisouii TaxID=396323 RepID=UPI00124EEFB6|nr:DciA family protein [Acinetobacter brisouii]